MLGLRCPKASVGFALLAQEASAILFDYMWCSLLFLFVSLRIVHFAGYRVLFDGHSVAANKTPLSHITAVGKDNN